MENLRVNRSIRAALDETQKTLVALFIDFENIAISAEDTFGQCDLSVIMEAAREYGRCVIRRAYGDWTRYGKYSHDLLEHAIESVQLFRYGVHNSKNAADIQMVADILEVVFIHPDIDVFVLATGDSDFSAVARKLRGYGKLVVGIGLRQATSEVLVNACDQFVLYNNLVEPETRTMAYTMDRARQLMLDAIHRLEAVAEKEGVFATRLKQEMLEQDPTFNEIKLGFSQFKQFLESQLDIIDIAAQGDHRHELIVRLKDTDVEQVLSNGTAEYRRALTVEGVRLLDPHTRLETLKDLYELLRSHPNEFTLSEAVLQLKTQYDANNIWRSRDEVQEVAKLIKYAEVTAPSPESWDLDRLSLKQDLQAQDFIDRCESVYIGVLLKKNMPIDPERIALLLFGTSDRRARVEQLKALAVAREMGGSDEQDDVTAWEWPRSLRQVPALQVALNDLDGCQLDQVISLERASELNSKGLTVRTRDFEQARGYFLKAAKMMHELLCDGVSGASLMDLEWYLASYCAATAGAYFFSYDYAKATDYYLAFFSLVKETELVWEKLQSLAQPMLSFYFTIAANENRQLLDVSPGRTHPARIAVLVYTHPNPAVQKRAIELAEMLAEVNPTILRGVIQRLSSLDDSGVDGAQKTREGLLRLVGDSVRAA